MVLNSALLVPSCSISKEGVSEAERIRSSVEIKKKLVCSDVKILKADSQKIQNMTRFLSNATKSGLAVHHLFVMNTFL